MAITNNPLPKWSHQLKQEIEELVANQETKQAFLDDLELWLQFRWNYIKNSILAKMPKHKLQGRPKTAEHRAKLSEANKGCPNKHLAKSIHLEGQDFSSIREASRATNIGHTTILYRVRNRNRLDYYYLDKDLIQQVTKKVT